MNKDVAIIVAFFMGIFITMFYDYLKIEWKHKRNRKRKFPKAYKPVSYTHLTLPTIHVECRSRWSPYH